ncbi:hypothetical protein [Salipiger sp.]|uniref:hypothetical protein n=1 Tax=Salipiger sp. TaxID=2078585 RepID=UPI003A9829A0
MSQFTVEPVPGYDDDILNEYNKLPLKCADGLEALIDSLERRDPSIRDRCGLLDDRYEIYAIPIPDCPRRCLVISIDIKDKSQPRALHGTLLKNDTTCDRGRRLATRQLKLINPTWET